MYSEQTHSLSVRNNYYDSKEVFNVSFKKENRFKESWMGMYSFFNEEPTEKDTMFGNFQFEIDEDNFDLLKEKMIAAIEYLQNKYLFKREDFFLKVTNRSIWALIPAKVFGVFSRKNLHKIHKKMATEINNHLLEKFDKGIDLSIYRWNGLTRNLGSFLPKVKKWVSKFDICHLEDSNSMDDLRNAPYDNFFTIHDSSENPSAKKWFLSAEARVLNKKNSITTKIKEYFHLGMEKFIEKGELSFNRNLHIYSVSLYLKDKGFSFEQIKKKVQSSFNNAYVMSREAVRTIKSAATSNKHFASNQMKGILDDSIFLENEDTKDLDTFIIPRKFIEALQSVKATHNSYKLLIDILKTKQVNGSNYTYDLKGIKHKKHTIGWFEKIKEAGVINYAVRNDILTASLVYFEDNIYTSHIVVPVKFVESKDFKEMGREFVLLCEIWRSGYKQACGRIHFNTKEDTIKKTLRMNTLTYRKYLSRLKKGFFVAGKKAFTDASKQTRKKKALQVSKMHAVIGKASQTVTEGYLDRRKKDLRNHMTGISVCSTLVPMASQYSKNRIRVLSRPLRSLFYLVSS